MTLIHDVDISAEPSPSHMDVATPLGISCRSVQQLIATGKLRKLPLVRAVRIAPAEFQRLCIGGPIVSD